jgi:Winged helix DNA-binding domain
VHASPIARARLRSQRLSGSGFTTPQDAVKWLGAVQAQDFEGAKWAVGQRVRDATDEQLEQAFADGSILRTHVLRPTWHLVAPADIRWMLELTAPRIDAAMRSYYRKYSLDEATFKRSNVAIASALRDAGRELTRDELRDALRRDGIETDGVRLAFALLRAELDRVVCSGGRSARRLTYALFDRRVPASRALSREQALGELTRRYFTSHGPATLQDFAWWSGLTVADGRTGLEVVGEKLQRAEVDGKSYWLSEPLRRPGLNHFVHLLPPYDEYLVAYRNRAAALHPSYGKQGMAAQLASTIIVNGQIVGTWRRTLTRNAAVVTLRPFAELRRAEKRAVLSAASRYGTFVGRTVAVED